MRSITLPLFAIVLTFDGAAGLAAIPSTAARPSATLLAPTPPMGFKPGTSSAAMSVSS